MPQVKCPNGHRLQVSDKAIGQTISCPSCQASFLVEGDADASDSMEEKRPALGVAKTLPGGFTINSLMNCFVGRPLLFFGLILVVLGRGCDATSLRSVGRTDAQYRQARTTFDLEWDGKQAKARQEVDKKQRALDDLFKGGKFDAETQKQGDAMRKELQTLRDELTKIQQEQSSKRLEKEAGEWKPLIEASMKGHTNHQMSVYWYEWIFIFGTVVLILGILTLAFTGQGAEKWIAYIMIAIITFSIYVGGAAWFESVASSFDRGGPPAIIRDKFDR